MSAARGTCRPSFPPDSSTNSPSIFFSVGDTSSAAFEITLIRLSETKENQLGHCSAILISLIDRPRACKSCSRKKKKKFLVCVASGGACASRVYAVSGETPWLNTTTACSFPRPWLHPATSSRWPARRYEHDETPKSASKRPASEYTGVYSHPAFGNFSVYVTASGALAYSYGTLLRGRLDPAETSDKFYMSLDPPLDYRMVFYPLYPNGFPVYFGAPRGAGRRQTIKVPYLEFSLPPTFRRHAHAALRQSQTNRNSSFNGSVTVPRNYFLVLSVLAMSYLSRLTDSTVHRV